MAVMVTQVRIYTVNRGMLDAWVKHFNENIVPTSAKFGVRVLGAWVNRPQNEFIWVRTFESEEALQKYEKSPERAAYLDTNRELLAKTEFRNVEDVLRVPATAATG
jgi:quinol monooxygenase YgiN